MNLWKHDIHAVVHTYSYYNSCSKCVLVLRISGYERCWFPPIMSPLYKFWWVITDGELIWYLSIILQLFAFLFAGPTCTSMIIDDIFTQAGYRTTQLTSGPLLRTLYAREDQHRRLASRKMVPYFFWFPINHLQNRVHHFIRWVHILILCLRSVLYPSTAGRFKWTIIVNFHVQGAFVYVKRLKCFSCVFLYRIS